MGRHREAFGGSRAAFLDAQRDAYAAAVISNDIADCVASIQRRYFKRYPIDLGHDIEPSAEFLAAVDDDAADPEPLYPDEDGMTPEGYDAALKAFEARQELIKFRKGVSVCTYFVISFGSILTLRRPANQTSTSLCPQHTQEWQVIWQDTIK